MGQWKYQQMCKTDCKNQKLWAEGIQEDILHPHIEPYADALAHSHITEHDYLQQVYNEYHQLIPWWLNDDKEPNLLLPTYDPKAMDSEVDLSAEDALLKARTIAKKNKVRWQLVVELVLVADISKKAIRWWLEYCVCCINKNHKPSMDPEKNPYAALLAKLSGIDPPKKKVRQGHQQFMHECSDILQPLYNAAWDIKGWRRTIKMMWTSIQR